MTELNKYITEHYLEYLNFSKGWCYKHHIPHSMDSYHNALCAIIHTVQGGKIFDYSNLHRVDAYFKRAIINQHKSDQQKEMERQETPINNDITKACDDQYREFNVEKAKSLLYALFDDLEFKETDTKRRYKKVIDHRLEGKYETSRGENATHKDERHNDAKLLGFIKTKMHKTYPNESFNKLSAKYDLYEEVF